MHTTTNSDCVRATKRKQTWPYHQHWGWWPSWSWVRCWLGTRRRRRLFFARTRPADPSRRCAPGVSRWSVRLPCKYEFLRLICVNRACVSRKPATKIYRSNRTSDDKVIMYTTTAEFTKLLHRIMFEMQVMKYCNIKLSAYEIHLILNFRKGDGFAKIDCSWKIKSFLFLQNVHRITFCFVFYN